MMWIAPKGYSKDGFSCLKLNLNKYLDSIVESDIRGGV